MGEATPHTIVENIDAIAHIEQESNRNRNMSERVGDVVGGFAGTLVFVVVQLVLVAGWTVVNAGLVPGVPAFDPFPYSLLGTMMSIQGVLLAAFVLMKQGYEGRMSERRAHLSLQVNMLAEKEMSKLIQMIERMSATQGTERQVVDEESHEMGEVTAVDNLAEELDRRLEPKE